MCRSIEDTSTMKSNMSELAAPLKDLPPVEFACAYGSGVFPQTGLVRTREEEEEVYISQNAIALHSGTLWVVTLSSFFVVCNRSPWWIISWELQILFNGTQRSVNTILCIS
jgi:hypothetical protein